MLWQRFRNVAVPAGNKHTAVFPAFFHHSSLLFNRLKLSEYGIGISGSIMKIYESRFSFEKSQYKNLTSLKT